MWTVREGVLEGLPENEGIENDEVGLRSSSLIAEPFE